MPIFEIDIDWSILLILSVHASIHAHAHALKLDHVTREWYMYVHMHAWYMVHLVYAVVFSNQKRSTVSSIVKQWS